MQVQIYEGKSQTTQGLLTYNYLNLCFHIFKTGIIVLILEAHGAIEKD